MRAEPESKKAVLRPRAAQYVRMSTDRQAYSTENQAAAIAIYAIQRSIDIVHTYKDEGRSGLTLRHREGLQQLLADVETGRADFSMVLVYDVSRWGRFQDADESAHYEFICKRAGVKVIYCAELFENDSSVASVILKTVKRVMAGEYSRELGVRVRQAQCSAAVRGFWQGGPPPFGLRRQIVDRDRRSKGILEPGERKMLQSDRIILVPGPKDEVASVRFMFRAFVHRRCLLHEIATALNTRRSTTRVGGPWTARGIRNVLSNPAYAGHNRYNVRRRDVATDRRRWKNPPDQWAVAHNAFEPIVSAGLFEAARTLLAQRGPRFTSDGMLLQLRQLLAKEGTLSQRIVSEAVGVPSLTTIRNRLGGMQGVYEKLAVTPDRSPLYTKSRRRLRDLRIALLEEAWTGLARVGATTRLLTKRTMLFLVNESIVVAPVVCRQRSYLGGTPMWRFVFQASHSFDFVLVRLMDAQMAATIGFLFIRGAAQRIDRSLSRRSIQLSGPDRLESLDDFFTKFAAKA